MVELSEQVQVVFSGYSLIEEFVFACQSVSNYFIRFLEFPIHRDFLKNNRLKPLIVVVFSTPGVLMFIMKDYINI